MQVEDEGEDGIAVEEPADAPAEAACGPAAIRRFARLLPNQPGVYRMLDRKGDALYVGKARNLKARVAAYTRTGGHTNRIAAMIALTASMEFVTTATRGGGAASRGQSHQEAEAALQRHAARRQVVSLYSRSRATIPVRKLAKHRGARSRPGRYFGPFASAGAVNRTHQCAAEGLPAALLLRQRVREPHPPVPALSDQALLGAMHRRDLPGRITRSWSQEAEAFLGGRSQLVKAELAEAMEQAAERLDFEQAARYRDRISALSFVTAQQGINPERIEEADVFGLAQEGGQFASRCSSSAPARTGATGPIFRVPTAALEAGEVLGAFLAQFYDDKPAPQLILLSHEVANAPSSPRP